MRPNSRLRVIGVTGGVGAGKSSVLSVLQNEFGAYVIRADEVGHRLRRPGGEIYRWMVKRYGTGILAPDQTVDAAAVAALVFPDRKLTAELNASTHPLIRKAIIKELDGYEGSLPEKESGLAVLEAALLTEGGLAGLCEEIWYVYAPAPVREERLMRTRGYSKARCREIMSRQKTDREFRTEADRILDNGGSLEETRRQIYEAVSGFAARRRPKGTTESSAAGDAAGRKER